MTTRNRAPAPRPPNPAARRITQGDDDRFGHPTFTEGPKRPTWAARRDPSGRETLEYSESSITNVAVRFYTVRYDADASKPGSRSSTSRATPEASSARRPKHHGGATGSSN